MAVLHDPFYDDVRWTVNAAELYNVMKHIERGELTAELGYVKLTANGEVDAASLPEEAVPDYG